MESRFICSGGVQLHALWRFGNGPGIIIVPGAMADAADFVPVAEAMDDRSPLLIVNRRGRGDSGPQGTDYDLPTEVDDLRAWIDEVQGEVILVGWSLGGTIALEAAAQDSRVTSVIAYDPVLPPFAGEAVPALAAANLDERVTIVNRDISNVPANEVAAMRDTPAWAHLRDLAGPLASELEALNSFSPTVGWSAIDASLLVGEHSQGVLPYGPAFERVSAAIPSAEVTVLKGHGHLAHVEDPKFLGTEVQRLLRSKQ
ncbi:alpha/beta fold hydrolase [Brevibacterium epidermidis]|uniref:alpha/beta fold hydrolase n=1 Tax=Brevibacterium epidermidis TaxID=1698 RepID=UPI000786720E|nr:alpha/beta hydrolase [Brevibacterium epidermidis]